MLHLVAAYHSDIVKNALCMKLHLFVWQVNVQSVKLNFRVSHTQTKILLKPHHSNSKSSYVAKAQQCALECPLVTA